MMNRLIFSLLSAAILLPLTAQADEIRLRSSDGTGIIVGYDLDEVLVPGSAEETWLNGLSVLIDGADANTAAVIVGYCSGIGTPRYVYSLTCRMEDGDPWIHVSESCRVGARDNYTKSWVRRTLPSLRLEGRYREGRTERCDYELAVVKNGQWLTDPVNGTHNFHLILR